ncbi:MAG: D-alanyl-D-alanine carboxypeptidase [Oscillospiraceae bacterium]|nr:D-alanyl-D-alanine carboxypeptidase [Oscillospiraceae bacterium]
MKKTRFAATLLLLAVSLSLSGFVSAAESSGSTVLDEMEIAAQSAILYDADYHEVLFEQGADEKSYPASITKVMTALLAVEAIERGELSETQVVTLGSDLNAGIGEGGSTADLKTGEEIGLKDLLACALIKSANEACNAIAVTVSGDIDTFVALMNQRAQELGMENTHFVNTHGYHDENHYTTAYDIALMCEEAMSHALFAEIVSSSVYTVPATNISDERVLHDTNALLSSWYYVENYRYEYATGIKTGSTPEAGYCLASSATKENRHLIAVVLGAENPTTNGTTDRLQFSESKRLLEWGFKNFSRRSILDSTAMLATVPVTLGKDADCVTVHPSGTLEASLPNDLDLSAFDITTTLTAETLEAPVEEGQVLGTVTASYNGRTYGTLDLVALNSVERSSVLYTFDRIQKFFTHPVTIVIIAVIIILIVVMVLRRTILRPRRNRHHAYTGNGTSRYKGGRRRR